MSDFIISLLSRGWIVGVMEGIVLEGSIETRTIVRGEREALLQPFDQVGVADKVPPI